VTAIYSRADAVVAWEACIDQNGVREHVEVRRLISVWFFCEVTRSSPSGSPTTTSPPVNRRQMKRCRKLATNLAVIQNASPYPQLDGTGTYIGFAILLVAIGLAGVVLPAYQARH
jgi:hypothetical protein